MAHVIAAIFSFALFWTGAAAKEFRLAADAGLIENGAVKYLLPRFSLKTGVRIAVSSLAESAAADAVLSVDPAAPGARAAVAARPVFKAVDGDAPFTLTVFDGDAAPHAERFLKWLTSEIGRKALAKFKADGAAAYAPWDGPVEVEVAEAPEGDASLGETLSLRRCGRCHVVNEKNRFGGIGSSPSFGALRGLPRWRERFEAFWTLNPHPAFTQIEGVTEPFDISRPSPIAPLELTLDEVDAILAFVIGMKPKDLGGPLIVQ